MASQLQTRHLLDRLNRVQVKYPADPVEPADVKAARKLIAAFEKKRRAARGKAFDAFNKAKTAAREKILFGDPGEALAAVKKLEAHRG